MPALLRERLPWPTSGSLLHEAVHHRPSKSIRERLTSTFLLCFCPFPKHIKRAQRLEVRTLFFVDPISTVRQCAYLFCFFQIRPLTSLSDSDHHRRHVMSWWPGHPSMFGRMGGLNGFAGQFSPWEPYDDYYMVDPEMYEGQLQEAYYAGMIDNMQYYQMMEMLSHRRGRGHKGWGRRRKVFSPWMDPRMMMMGGGLGGGMGGMMGMGGLGGIGGLGGFGGLVGRMPPSMGLKMLPWDA